MIPKSILGKTGARVTILGLGGEGLLRTYNYEKEKLKSLKSFGQTKKEIKKDSESQLFSLIQVKILLK